MRTTLNLKNWLILIPALLLSVSATAQINPHTHETDYSEYYRGQFHFSPQSEWMNDINGLVYQGGKYHMIYQWGKSKRHGGYATSTDLLHWEDKGVALVPKQTFIEGAVQNVSGNEIYSGSAVVVSGQTAKAITGSDKEAIIAIYTGTGVGTCLAWSNDVGETWHDYPGNPVAHPTTGAVPRDPCVLWHEASSKWVLAIYEKSNNDENTTSFYGSADLINWDFLSTIKFGYECPDLIELPVDGNANNMKWLLYDAKGSYLVGQFDGNTFTTDQEALIMDVGPDFYAAQTFPMGGLPNDDPRIIQIAWMDRWNGGVGETIWERNATFPVSLGLKTDAGKIKVTRTPISQIEDLYTNTISKEALVIEPGENILSSVQSKTFDLTAEFDLNETTATSFGFKIANKIIKYDTSSKELLGKSLLPDSNQRIKIRILVDWAMLEVFANEGVFSFTQQFAFTPNESSLALFSEGGNTKLVSLTFNEVGRIWPGEIEGPKNASSETIIDDRDSPMSYSRGWWQSNESLYYKGTCTVSGTKDASLECTFEGNSIAWYGLKNTDLGFANVYIDEVLEGNIDCYGTGRLVTALFSKDELGEGSHTIKIVVTGDKNPSSAGTSLVHDYFEATKKDRPNSDGSMYDPMDNLNLIYRAENMAISTDNATSFNNDAGRSRRAGNNPTTASLIYKVQDITDFTIEFWNWKWTGAAALKVYGSADDITYQEIPLDMNSEDPGGSHYFKTISPTGIISENTDYLKIELSEADEWWKDQIGSISITAQGREVSSSIAEDIQEKTEFTVFPSPTDSSLSFEMPEAFGNTIVTIHTMSGKLIYKEAINVSCQAIHTINVASYIDGMYIISLQSKTQCLESKFLKL